jgi:hypothetical protein
MLTRLVGQWLPLSLVASLLICGCAPVQDGNGNGNGGPSPGGQGIPDGTYSGTLQCTETISAVSQAPQQETQLGQSSTSPQITASFGSSGVVLGSGGQPLQAGSTVSTTVNGVAASATVRSVTTAIDWLSVIADGSVAITVPDRGQAVVLGVVTAIYGFAEPDKVNLVTENVFTSDVIDGEFVKVVGQCSGDLAFQP